ncbi:hypothetical protein [Flammeovirga aprica]|uniref:Uncharacterized protein n=1 Tax=Flammeovirga aprica JL-4 TaxID=694437 RepID=A0A7X9RUP5_9BACT|nr:hypothetical protein [Flammeovirga aprica]NME69046.1 hypothetical protein [Flammeovirga aprica JL-4]
MRGSKIIALIKTVILVVTAINTAVSTNGSKTVTMNTLNLKYILIVLGFGIIVVPFLCRGKKVFGYKRVIKKPSWSDNPLILTHPLPFFQFGAFYLITVGMSGIIGTAYKFQELHYLGFYGTLYGIADRRFYNLEVHKERLV